MAQVLDVTFAGQPYLTQPLEARIISRYGEHDTAVVTYAVPTAPIVGLPTTATPAEGATVKITVASVSTALQPTTWVGYVHHVSQSSVQDAVSPRMQVVCIGTSWTMTRQQARAYTNIPLSTLAAQIAAANGLRALVSATTAPLRQVTQFGQSDFQFLKEQAQRAGQRLSVTGGVLSLVLPGQLLARRGQGKVTEFVDAATKATVGSATPLVVPRTVQSPGVLQAVLEFRITGGTALTLSDGFPGSFTAYGAVLTPGSFTPRLGMYQYDAGSTVHHIDTTRDITNPAAGQRAVVSAGSPYTLEAETRLVGVPDLRPGDAMNVQSARIDPQYNGQWLVTGVDHHLDFETTYSTAQLARTDALLSGTPGRVISGATDAGNTTDQGGTWRTTDPGTEIV